MKMDSGLKLIVVLAVAIIGLWVTARLTNMLQLFSIPTISNYPTIQVGNRILASNLVKPERFNFICYYTAQEYGRGIWIHRLCGLEGDKIEIKDGVLFVNDKNSDEKLSLAHNYMLTEPEFEKVRKFGIPDEKFIPAVSTDSIIANLSDKAVRNNSIKAIRQILPISYWDEYISKQFPDKEWNLDNFGPIVVPQGKYFLLGDNRSNSLDSRYQGFIDKSKYVATVINVINIGF